MEPKTLVNIKVTIKNNDVKESLYNICNVISKRMNKVHLNFVFIKREKNLGYDLCITCDNTLDEIENCNEKSVYYMIPSDPKIVEIEYKCLTKRISISVDAKVFYLFAKIKKSTSQKTDRKFFLYSIYFPNKTE